VARTFVAALLVGLFAGAAVVAALVIGGVTKLPVTLAFGAVLVLGLLAGESTLARALGPRGPFAASCTVASLAPFVWLAARWALSEPLVASGFRCGTPLATAMIFAPFFVGAATVVAFLGFAKLFAGTYRWLDRPWVAIAKATLLLGGLLVLLATVRIVGRPEPDAWRGRLPIVAELGALTFRPWVDPVPAPPHQAVLDERAELAPGVVLLRGCRLDVGCSVALLRDGKAGDRIGVDRGEVVVRRMKNGFLFDGGRWSHGALGDDGRRRDVNLDDVASELSAPRGWLVGAWGTLLVGAFFVVRALRIRVDLAGLRDGAVHDDGIVLEDGSEWPVPAPGFALGTRVLARDSTVVPQFRNDPTPSFVVGSKEALAAAARHLATRHALLGSTILLLGLAPLAAAALSRLVL